MEAKKQIKLKRKYSPRSYNRYREVPELSISGIWLEQAGFAIGSIVEIEISENQLIMRTDNHDD